MKLFAGIAKYDTGVPIVERQILEVLEFPQVVRRSHLHLWSPGTAVSDASHRYVVGIACWHRRDLSLLDAINNRLEDAKFREGFHVDVFLFDEECRNQEDLDAYVPQLDMRSISHPPVIGYWQHRRFIDSKFGVRARKWIVEAFGLDDEQIVSDAITPGLAKIIRDHQRI